MENYTSFQKFLHDFVLGKKFINKSLFEIEKIIYLKKIEIKNERHVFVSGLPRSGTTSLLNFIYSSNEYASLTYKSMPFLLSPNLSKLFNKKDISKKERMHADGITYDINSPEAFDEVFFNNNEEFVKNELVNYIQLICSSENKKKYLSKNNLNFKRINLITKLFPNCNFLIPIRDPLHHSYSLLSQHLHFKKLQSENDFIRRYMNYLGHNEFGFNHKSWNKPVNFNDFIDLNYWLEQWILFYTIILNNFKSNKKCNFVIYEKLDDPNYIKLLLEKIDLHEIKYLKSDYFKNLNNKEINFKYDNNIYNNAKSIYLEFLNY